LIAVSPGHRISLPQRGHQETSTAFGSAFGFVGSLIFIACRLVKSR
jgi:hypothetical protein